MRYSSLLIATLFAGTAVTAQANKFYKWTDANGNVHYSQTIPKNQKQAKQLDIRAGTSKPVATRTSPEKTAKASGKEENPEKKQIEELQGKVKEQNDQMKQQRCKALKANLDNLTQGGRIYDMQDGKRSYLSGKEIDERLKKAQKTYQKDCS